MKLSNLVRSPMIAVAAGATVLAMVGAGTAVAAKQITSAQIKNGTIQTQDLTKNNFARFTATESVVTAWTPVSANPTHAGERVVDVAATGTTPLVTLVLDKGTWKINGTAQFWHKGPAVVTDPDYGVVSIPGLQNGYASNITGDVPDGGANPAQTQFTGTIKITANDTPVVISGAFTGGNTGQAGVYVQATQYEYVKLFKNGNPV